MKPRIHSLMEFSKDVPCQMKEAPSDRAVDVQEAVEMVKAGKNSVTTSFNISEEDNRNEQFQSTVEVFFIALVEGKLEAAFESMLELRHLCRPIRFFCILLKVYSEHCQRPAEQVWALWARLFSFKPSSSCSPMSWGRF